MANQQQYHAYLQNKGTLTEGQSISVNKFTVQVERYLSQGGFSHVYLVRTATPVYNTTRHVLKRIAVASEEMLTEVNKEVEIMRCLKGHPNIVHLIDAASHKMPSGGYEVFILMEFCPGGGIIDMMNRRLRERLTEAEILQIFADVCEGVARMHNSRPPLLHRDLKVENILQSSATSYKLCDFGSATTVAKPPANMHDIRALEADLNRHTTLQYRAPEMVDLYLRRPVDEKSDVWALGVLLYKLCYYTTPFEEHGPLAIINVQYRIPPYPVYSNQMNQLIATMLQEHGSRRPSVFELLTQVHLLRGTKARIQYTIPIAQPFSPRHQTQLKPSPSPNHIENLVSSQVTQPIVSNFRKPDSISSTSLASKTQLRARDKAADDLPLMRRGRPTSSKGYVSGPKHDTLQKPSAIQTANFEAAKPWTEEGFVSDDEGAWKAAIANTMAPRKDEVDDVWKIGVTDFSRTGEMKEKIPGFVDDFAEKLWESFEDKPDLPSQIKTNPHMNRRATVTSTRTFARPSSGKGKDAFEGLGFELSSDRRAPTLGEARKLRTGLATLSTRPNGSEDKVDANLPQLTPPRQPHLSSSPLQTQLLSSAPQPPSSASGMSWRTSPQPSTRPSSSVQAESLPAETRFPSLEVLDATFATRSEQASRTNKSQIQQAPGTPALPPRNNRLGRSVQGTSGLLMKSAVQSRGSNGVRSVQVTGIAMRELRPDTNDRRGGPSEGRADGPSRIESQPSIQSNLKRPSLTRKHRSSIIIKHAPPNTIEDTGPTSPLSSLTFENLASRSPRLPTGSKDWLTGEDDLLDASSTSVLVPAPPTETVVFRESPSKRASVIQRSTVPIQDAIFPQHDHTSSRQDTPSPPAPAASNISPTISRFTRTFPPIETTDQSPAQDRTPVATHKARKPVDPESSSSADEGPEDTGGFKRTPVKASPGIGKPKRKGRQSSVHDLVDLWGGGVGHKDNDRETLAPRTTKDLATSSQGHKAPAASSLSSAKSNPNPQTPMLTPLAPSSDPRRSPGATPSATSRSRPQSMIIFPSKSTDAYPALSAGHTSVSASLAPPSPLNQRTSIRRTSISDMVQRYEGISGKRKSTGGTAPSPNVSRSVAKAGSLMTENGLHPKGQKQKDEVGLLPPVSKDADYRWRSSSPSNEIQKSPSLSKTSPITPPSPLPYDAVRGGSEEAISCAPKLSSSREISKPVFTSSSKPVEDPSSRLVDERSSSPERPYQGVGKLIDQWQRKTAEASATRTPIGRGRGSSAGTRGFTPGPQ